MIYVCTGLSRHAWRVLSSGYHQGPEVGAPHDDSAQASSDEEPLGHTQRRRGRVGRQKQFRRGSDSVASGEGGIDSEWVKKTSNGTKRRDGDIENDSVERRVPRIDQEWFKGKTFEKIHRKDSSDGTEFFDGLAREHSTAGSEMGPPTVFKPIQRDSGKSI